MGCAVLQFTEGPIACWGRNRTDEGGGGFESVVDPFNEPALGAVQGLEHDILAD